MRLRTIKLSVRYFWIKRKPKAIRKPRKKNIPYVGDEGYYDDRSDVPEL
jgi:hypothetical protein